MRGIFALSIAFMGAATSCIAAHAQTAEETVVYMLHGIEKEAVEVRNRQTYAIRPAVEGYGVEFTVDGVVLAALKYKQIDKCHYEVRVSESKDNSKGAPIVELYSAVLDWSAVSLVEALPMPEGPPNAPLKQLNIVGLALAQCRASAERGCRDVNAREFVRSAINFADPTRIKKAYEYFKENFCKGAAF